MWISLIERNEALLALYQEGLPVLGDLFLHEINIITGEDLEIDARFDLGKLPEKMPKKWLDKKVNRVQITLAFVQAKIEAMDFSQSISSIENIIIEQVNGQKYIIFLDTSKNEIITMKSTWIYLKSVSGYRNE